MTTNLTTKPGNMTDVIEMFIKDAIDAYPAVGEVLSSAGIGCVTCSIGTCKIKEVVSIHNLNSDQEQGLFAGIAAVIFPGQTPSLPRTTQKAIPSTTRALSPPLQALVDEHTNIKRVLARLPGLSARIQSGLDKDTRPTILEVINFIRQYADTFHHAKEEDILFKYFETSPVLTVMLNEHETGRRHVQNALAALERNDIPGIAEALTAYGLLLTEHIRKEDEILYPWMNRELTDSQVGQLFSKFNAVNEQFKTRVEQTLALVAKLEKAAEQRS
jgi:hemerythrin-like domain-containing protein